MTDQISLISLNLCLGIKKKKEEILQEITKNEIDICC